MSIPLPARASVLLFLCFGATAAAHEDGLLSIEELLEMEVTTVSKKPQSVTQAAASVFVITREDIRRSGAVTVPEALRLAPGLNVGRIGPNRWAVSIRGNADRFANKLLVMLDGRTLYTPLFAGVIWGTQELLLEEIERIEVIRGPGAVAWGANAVNGVINIITRHAGDSRGRMLAATVGNEERATLGLRQGWAVGEDQFVRVSAKLRQVDNSVNLHAEPGSDDARNVRLDGRWDGMASDDRMFVTANYYHGSNRDTQTFSLRVPPWQYMDVTTENYEGAALVGSWRHMGRAETTLHAFLDYSHFDLPFLREDRLTLDLEFQRCEARQGRHEWIWGGGYRNSGDDVHGEDIVIVRRNTRTLQLLSLFAQDEITSPPWSFTLGARLEHNDFTGVEFQPNARLLWQPEERHSAWLSASRAVRTPSRIEDDLSLRYEVIPPGKADNPLPLEIVVSGNRDLDSEVLDAFELGYRGQWSKHFSLEGVGFIHTYHRSAELLWDGVTTTQYPDRIELPIGEQNNPERRRAKGFELAFDWRPSEAWRISSAYSYLDGIKSESVPYLSYSVGGYAYHHWSLRLAWNVTAATELDLWLKHVSGYEREPEIPAYTVLDVRLGWQPRPDLELMLTGQNLLDNRHPEMESSFFRLEATQVERGVYLKAIWGF